MPKVTTKNDVTIIERKPNFSELAWSTLVQLGATGRSPGTELTMAREFLAQMRDAKHLNTRFVNPMFVVSAREPTANFIRASRKAQQGWLKAFRRGLPCSAGELRRQIRCAHVLTRQLTFTGVLVIAGKHVLPGRWPTVDVMAAGNDPARRNLIGRRFGRLVVIAKSTAGYWACRCCDDRLHRIRDAHLLTGAVRSCGCLKRDYERLQAVRKAARCRN